MTVALATAPKLGLVLDPLATAQLPAVVDPAAVTASIARAFELGMTLNRRFEIVLTGTGKRVDEMPRVALARSVRVGGGTVEGALWNVAMRAALFATPVSAALLTAAGAADVSDLALVLTGIAPYMWAPAAAVRSLRAERAANADIKLAATTRAGPSELAAIDGFVRQATASADSRVQAVARASIDAWLITARQDESIGPAGEAHLVALRDALPEPPPEIAEQARRLLALGRVARTLASEKKVVESHVSILRDTLSTSPAVEQAAVAPWLARLLRDPAHSKLRDVLPKPAAAPRPAEQNTVKFVSSGADSA